MNTERIINSIEKLKSEAKNGLDCFIALSGGFRSSKHIWYKEDDNTFEIINQIDGAEQCLTEAELYTESNIGEAMQKNSLIKDL